MKDDLSKVPYKCGNFLLLRFVFVYVIAGLTRIISDIMSMILSFNILRGISFSTTRIVYTSFIL